MTNFIKKLLTAVALAGTICVTPVIAQDAPAKPAVECANGAWADYVSRFTEQGNEVTPLNAELKASLIAKLGPPPGVEGDFDGYLVTKGPLGAIFVVKDGCIAGRVGPTLYENLKHVLGLVDA